MEVSDTIRCLAKFSSEMPLASCNPFLETKLTRLLLSPRTPAVTLLLPSFSKLLGYLLPINRHPLFSRLQSYDPSFSFSFVPIILLLFSTLLNNTIPLPNPHRRCLKKVRGSSPDRSSKAQALDLSRSRLPLVSLLLSLTQDSAHYRSKRCSFRHRKISTHWLFKPSPPTSSNETATTPLNRFRLQMN